MKDFLIVSVGSFFGGGLRFLVSRLMGLLVATPFPLGMAAVWAGQHLASVLR